jgi:hypothetical protein
MKTGEKKGNLKNQAQFCHLLPSRRTSAQWRPESVLASKVIARADTFLEKDGWKPLRLYPGNVTRLAINKE